MIILAEFSVTNTAGTGSERHNHSIEYRDSLKHTHDSNDQSVVELVPYIPYKEHIFCIADFVRTPLPFVKFHNFLLTSE